MAHRSRPASQLGPGDATSPTPTLGSSAPDPKKPAGMARFGA